MSNIEKNVRNWGNYPSVNANFFEDSNFDNIINFLSENNFIIARGNGKCYGDSSLQNSIVSTLKMNKILLFDKEEGIIECESGVLLSDILNLIVPAGFFLPVTPGTKFITVGGAVASNIHGKNHHKEGAFSKYIISFELMIENGIVIKCSKSENYDLFVNSIGGMGLTGIITTVKIQLKSIETAFIKQKTIKAKNLDQILDYFEKYNHYIYSVAWIDCIEKGKSMGRSVLMLGEHAKTHDLNKNEINKLKTHSENQINIPFFFPNFTLNKYTIGLFNSLFYNKQLVKEKNNIVHYDSFFYPLDKLNNWNRIYGKNGFTQYQFVIPFKNGREGLKKIMNEITNSGCGSFLAVLKTFGKQDAHSSSLSFPTEGYTLALDFKITPKVFSLLNRLDEIVLDYKGKLYLTKDSRMSKEMFQKTYSYRSDFGKFSSTQFERLSKL
jgi:decaprenylphospho-beta-D-ribofuranose 2-oxidase